MFVQLLNLFQRYCGVSVALWDVRIKPLTLGLEDGGSTQLIIIIIANRCSAEKGAFKIILWFTLSTNQRAVESKL